MNKFQIAFNLLNLTILIGVGICLGALIKFSIGYLRKK